MSNIQKISKKIRKTGEEKENWKNLFLYVEILRIGRNNFVNVYTTLFKRN